MKIVKQSDGISVYKVKNAHETLNRIIARTQVSSNYMDVLCLIKDFGHQKDWIYSNHDAFVLDSIGPYRWIYYGVSETPWPILDRDVVAEVELMIDETQKRITVHSVAKPDLIPPSDELVRIQMMDSKWKITKIGENSTVVVMDILIDVGGAVPHWLVNLFSSNGPMGTFKNLKKELKKPNRQDCDCGYKELLN
ncbi:MULTISPECIES: START domain-containing protein [unclassified Lentimicrobium]|uniref:START domain-containing protein n=1 Tax=unclassified Lentimicrobium TaxID=2677434 RepID=UPI00155789E7|nr:MULTISPECIES: START domain-containing protein [unclassified Lentimicrobium]NPD46805.1 hypothetical protein [Lentimicrobium sp. S6]NPD85608.1 hypothetical protein [Lentimicrobium sp. L6]